MLGKKAKNASQSVDMKLKGGLRTRHKHGQSFELRIETPVCHVLPMIDQISAVAVLELNSTSK